MTDEQPEWVEHFANLSVEDAVDLAAAQGRPVRVVRPGEAVTMDFAPDRVNLLLDNDGQVAKVTWG